MPALKFSQKSFLTAAKKEDDFTNTDDKAFERGAREFLENFYTDAMENEFLDYTRDDLIALARDFWMFGNRRVPGEVLVSVAASPAPLDAAKRDMAIQIIADDMSFLVDSLVAAISSMGINVSGLFHPIVEGYRDNKGRWADEGENVTESMILLMVPHQPKRRLAQLKAEIETTLKEVQIVNADFLPIVQTVRLCAEELKHSHIKVEAEEKDEAVSFLEWLADGNFVLFGARRYNYTKKGSRTSEILDYADPDMPKEQSLGVLRDPAISVLRQSSEPSIISSNVKKFIEESPPVTVAKSNVFARVHRRVRMDYVSVKHYSKTGIVTGETRFVGLFTAEAYNRSPQYVPLIRRKAARVLAQSKWVSGSHNAKQLEYVLSTYPRDELFQIDHEDLVRISTGIAQAFDRPRTRLFIRRDRFDRFVSALVYVPREYYNTRVRVRIGEGLKEAFGGRISAFYPQYSDSALARVHFIIGLNPDEGLHPDLSKLEAEISALAQPWQDGLDHIAEDEEDDGWVSIVGRYRQAFSVAYQDRYTPQEALADIRICETLNEQARLAVKVDDTDNDDPQSFHAKIYQLDQRLEPSDVMPVLTNFNGHVVQETGYAIRRDDDQIVWVHDFELRLPFIPDDMAKLAVVFEEAFLATWHGLNEDDGFNRLILPQNAHWRDVAFLRLVARYRRQSGLDPSENTQIEALEIYPDLTQNLLALKAAKFDPHAEYADMEVREKAVEKICETIMDSLNAVGSLEHDRVIRRMADVLIQALRTNFYQLDDEGGVKPYISLKIKSDSLDNLPAPKPYREIYVSSPIVEAIHLRFGPVARGGLRWSDRRDDFRTEVLGLVKAQQVKNAVIVPVGSKGGFFPKALPKGGSRAEVQQEAIRAYKTFISGILDITDNYAGSDTVSPTDVICWDKPDPYLVVAADKGTATFSDIANGISQDYGFWLDDAFASGGSAGYDHKVMGITARGGWEAVKRHFREMGKDIQTEDFTVIGVGDMSGDVFGNGMLLSQHIRLVAAFNHLDIFIDPNPNAKKSFKERQRLFKLPRSTWQDYNQKLISKGGGIFSRSEKSIPLSDEIKALTGLTQAAVTPNRLMHALLKSNSELLWFGGIGTYVKAEHESHAEVGDKANDPIRVNASQLKAKVVGEGANLGMTQNGRIEFARHGGRLNTDAIDNSAGVDSSDNEVNIKILLGGAIEQGQLKAKNRNALLAKMTDDVAALVLKHNYDQTGALSLAQMRALQDHDAYERLMRSLEKVGVLDREVETLPSTEGMNALAGQGKGLTRPEMSVLMAYVKNRLFDELIETDVADDPFMIQALISYFPQDLHKFKSAMDSHRLKREIITSRLVNMIIDNCGAVFMLRLRELTRGSQAEIAKAFIVAYETLNVRDLRADIAALDNKVDSVAQLKLHNEIAAVLMRVSAWLVRKGEIGDLSSRIERRAQLSALVDSDWLDILSPYDKRRADTRIRNYIKAGIPEDLATDVALLRSRASGFDVMALVETTGWSARDAAELFYDIGGRFKIDRIRAALLTAQSHSHWERLAVRHLQEDFYKVQARLAQHIAGAYKKDAADVQPPFDRMIAKWIKQNIPHMKLYEDTVSSMIKGGNWTVSKFTIVNAQLSDLIAGL